MIKDNKQRLFEIMKRVNNIPINENNVRYLTKEQFLNEIDFEGEFGDVTANCLRPEAVVKWLNDELERLKHNQNIKREKDRISRGTRDMIVTQGNINDVRNESGDINIDTFITNITKEPETIFDSNPKAEKSDVGRPQLTVNTGLPAIVGIVYDLDKKQFYSITTCPSAGKCQIGCYARKAFYGMDDSKTMKLTQRLNLLLNNPKRYEEMIFSELEPLAIEMRESSVGMPENYTLVIRWNDAGDFFGERYFKIAVDVTKTLLGKGYNVKSYAYSKRSQYVIELDNDKNFVINFSTDAAQDDIKAIKGYSGSETVKQSHRVPKDIFKGFFMKKGPHYVKNHLGLAKFVDDKAPEQLKDKIFNEYGGEFGFSRDSLKYNYELPKNPQEGEHRKYNVIVLPTGDSDIAAQRDDVRMSFLLEH